MESESELLRIANDMLIQYERKDEEYLGLTKINEDTKQKAKSSKRNK